jgi:hypothetical protein
VLAALALVAAQAAHTAAFSPQALFEAWPERRVVRTAAPCVRPAELQQALDQLAAVHPERLRLETIGRSVEGRPIRMLVLGRGERHVLLWSQMHGDEPSATPALLDLAGTLLSADAPEHRLILDRLTLVLVPMLNPDGAERYTRRNAQAIDVNRDALALSTPEGRLLKAVRDRFSPVLGFNLHDQNRRTSVGETGRVASIALLAVAGDAKGTLTPGRARARRVCSALVRALSPFVPGAIARYDEDWSPRAFGDNLTAWGTPVVLIESGAIPAGRSHDFLTRLNYVGLLNVLHRLAADDLAGESPALYEKLARNADGMYVDRILAGARVLQPPGSEPYLADVAWDVLDDDRTLGACPAAPRPGPSRIREVGDARFLSAVARSDAGSRLLLPALAVSVRGLSARAWLSPAALDDISRLGVARVRWHVDAAERAEARGLAEALAAPGRAAIEVVDRSSGERALVVAGPPPRAAAPVTLRAALTSLTGGAWRGADPLASVLPALVGAEPGGLPPLRPDAAASLLVLRPLGDGLDAGSLVIESVYVDGRGAGSAR